MADSASHALESLRGQEVVLDLSSPFVYLGRLVEAGEAFLVLEDADAHDLRDASVGRERYVLDARMHGINPNRRRTWVSLREIVGVSRLEDVLIP
ncbi:MAG: hypothetical protein ACYC35_20605 [Pirellulales bacterium]